jgi:hypothetical protein
MKRISIHLVVSMAFSLGAWGESAEQTPPAITVYTQFEHASSGVSIEMMREELEAIMRPLGLDFTWRDLPASNGNEVSVELVVVSFKGTCRMSDSLPSRGETGALGWTHISDGAILPFSDVDCDKIRRFISSQVRALDPAKQEIVYGRAIGRVLAHELYHVFTNTTKHASWGVAKAFYSAHDLVSDSFRFEEKDNRALRTGKLTSVLRGRRPPVLSFSGKR